MINLSVVIPAYNEEKRIVSTLINIGKYFESSNIKCEVIVVVNNSTDNTVRIVDKISKIYPNIRLVEIKGYTGKGGAISIGVMMAKGKYIAYQDADGSSDVSDLIKGLNMLKNNPNLDLAMGSRYMKNSKISGDLPAYRFILSRIFNIAVRALFQLTFSDTQCAVKIMKKSIAKTLFKNISAKKWAVDVNLLIDSKFEGYRVKEYPITWKFINGSKLNVNSALIEVSHELIRLKIYQVNRLFSQFYNLVVSFLPSSN